ncbi:anthranilate synthase component I [Hyphococcus luteus]|uniref:Anthranilate synthase n=1 Tax=Hyphococcus luteus TaxID=2058213 RepID=A0A2S7K0L1_9PROT|nr:anthranilate synthase component I [Marinicaulis flavus]PQA86050.1 anthranilate synthase component I [Marinicaulis flavus]
MTQKDYTTAGGVRVTREIVPASYEAGIGALCRDMDSRLGVVLASGFEFPGRYSRLDMGFVDPPVQIASRGRDFSIRALNERGEVILPAFIPALEANSDIMLARVEAGLVSGSVKEPTEVVPEEQRSRQPSVFSMLRACRDAFAAGEDKHLGLYGAFAYDLCFQFEPINLRLERLADHRDLALFLPDQITIVDHVRKEALIYRYDFEVNGKTTRDLPRKTADDPIKVGGHEFEARSDHAPGEYAANVEKAREAFYRGDLFEAVLSQTFEEPLTSRPSAIFERLSTENPSPYGAFMNLGQGEALVGSSPEMYVRVEGDRVETCPISGTAPRGRDALEDAENVRVLLNSEKDKAELTMCTDVDRNDKSRICTPGSVKVLGRRQLEFYSKLIHTVDHVEGYLSPGFDSLDAFLTHMWAVTVTGAPKVWAMQFIENHEKTARRWYGGAIGRLTFDGDMNTGLTIRTTRLHDGVAEVRAGATLLYDSDPQAEDAECRLKASALFAAIRGAGGGAAAQAKPAKPPMRRILLVDHQDSFVHTLGSYFRQLGAEVTTLRPDAARKAIKSRDDFDMAVLSPGPGRPEDFNTAETLKLLDEKGLPVFGVCLGLQAMVEYEGGALDVLAYPMHGKMSQAVSGGGRLFKGLSESFEIGRYHSLHANRDALPDCFEATAQTGDGVIMAVEHKTKPWAAVQFHPESILTSPQATGLPLLRNALEALCPKNSES